MPINNSIFTINDDLETRIKNICYDPLPKVAVRRLQCEENQRLGMIQPGAKFSGFQSSNGTNVGMNADDQRYEVTVEFQNVDIIDSLASGYLTISNLTAVSQQHLFFL
jgi:hypothetical protein